MTTYHLSLAALWARWNGQQGTQKQAERFASRLTVEQLERMLTARGINITAIQERTIA